jgi:hypothetical protein
MGSSLAPPMPAPSPLVLASSGAAASTIGPSPGAGAGAGASETLAQLAWRLMPYATEMGAAVGPSASDKPLWPDGIELAGTPSTGLPGSMYVNPGSGQIRLYGPDGYPVMDIDFDHRHPGVGSPHIHMWLPSPGGGFPQRGVAMPL